MKTIKLFLSIAALAIASTASAQFANATKSTSTTKSSSSSTTTTVNLSNWNSFYISIDSPALVWDDDDEEKFDGGFSVGYTTSQEISDSTPLFLEYGAELSYAYYSEGNDYDYNMSFFSALVPINVVYLYSINDNLSVAPYAGLYARYGISLAEKYSYNGEDYTNDWYDYDDMNRLTYGYQLGVNAHIKDKYIVGLKWQNDIGGIYDDGDEWLKYKNGVSITLGLKF